LQKELFFVTFLQFLHFFLDYFFYNVRRVAKQRDKAFLIKYFEDKGEAFCQQIEVFCSDMWKAYLNCAKEVFPNAIVVADRFHFFWKMSRGNRPC